MKKISESMKRKQNRRTAIKLNLEYTMVCSYKNASSQTKTENDYDRYPYSKKRFGSATKNESDKIGKPPLIKTKLYYQTSKSMTHNSPKFQVISRKKFET